MSKAWDLLQKIQFYSHLFWMFFWKISNKNIGFSWVFHGFSWFFHGFSRTQLPFSKQKPRGVFRATVIHLRQRTGHRLHQFRASNSDAWDIFSGIFGDFSDDLLVFFFLIFGRVICWDVWMIEADGFFSSFCRCFWMIFGCNGYSCMISWPGPTTPVVATIKAKCIPSMSSSNSSNWTFRHPQVIFVFRVGFFARFRAKARWWR